MLSFESAVFIKNCLFQKFLSETLSECQTFFDPDKRTDILSVLILVQPVSKGDKEGKSKVCFKLKAA